MFIATAHAVMLVSSVRLFPGIVGCPVPSVHPDVTYVSLLCLVVQLMTEYSDTIPTLWTVVLMGICRVLRIWSIHLFEFCHQLSFGQLLPRMIWPSVDKRVFPVPRWWNRLFSSLSVVFVTFSATSSFQRSVRCLFLAFTIQISQLYRMTEKTKDRNSVFVLVVIVLSRQICIISPWQRVPMHFVTLSPSPNCPCHSQMCGFLNSYQITLATLAL